MLHGRRVVTDEQFQSESAVFVSRVNKCRCDSRLLRRMSSVVNYMQLCLGPELHQQTPDQTNTLAKCDNENNVFKGYTGELNESNSTVWQLTLRRLLLPYGNSNKASCARPG